MGLPAGGLASGTTGDATNAIPDNETGTGWNRA
jgi:hypothetical protein